MSPRSSGAAVRPLLAVAALLGSLASGASALADGNPLVGTWRRTDGVTLTLDANGRFTRTAAGQIRVEGTYLLEEDALILLSDDGDLVGAYGVDLDAAGGKLTLSREGDEEDSVVEERYARVDSKTAPPPAPESAPAANEKTRPQGKPRPPATPATPDGPDGPPATAPRLSAGPLAGRWVVQDELGGGDVYLFLPGNRAAWGREPDRLSFGTYTLSDGALELVDVAGNKTTLAVQIAGDTLRYEVESSSGWKRMTTFRRDATPIAALARRYAAPPPAQVGAALTGRWDEADDNASEELVFAGDGRYYILQRSPKPQRESRLQTRGRITRIDARTLTLQARHQPPHTTVYAFYGPTRLIVPNEDSSGWRTSTIYRLRPGSQRTARGWADATEARIERENARWRKKFPVGPIASTARMRAVGNVPTDPNPTRIFPNGRVFQSIQAYFWMGTAWVVKVGPRAGATVYDRTDWYFLPSGRIYLRVASEGGGAPLVNGVWGRYTIDDKDRIRFEPDAGKPETLELDDGRRRLYQVYKGFKNLLWASGKVK